MRKLSLLALSFTLIIVLLTSCSNDNYPIATYSSSQVLAESSTQDNINILDCYSQILLNSKNFYSVFCNDYIDIQSLQKAISSNDNVDVAFSISNFAIFDLDFDETPELLLALNVNGIPNFGKIIFQYRNGQVYGFTVYSRALDEVKTDGTFSFISGAFDGGIGTITFLDDSYIIQDIAYSESTMVNEIPTISYYSNGTEISESDYLEILKSQDEKENIKWLDFNETNIKAEFSIS